MWVVTNLKRPKIRTTFSLYQKQKKQNYESKKTFFFTKIEKNAKNQILVQHSKTFFSNSVD